MSTQISILEDEQLLARGISKKLSKLGYEVSTHSTVQEFKKHFDKKTMLFIVDIGLPDGTGFEVIDWLRKEKANNSPVIITSGYSDTDNKIFGLHLGADDYLAKPFEPDELLARVKALLRRSFNLSPGNMMKYKDYLYNSDSKTLIFDGEEIPLTKTEQELVKYFFLNPGKVVEKNTLAGTIWGVGQDKSPNVTDNTINVTIARLRKKLGDDFDLKTVVGNGYSLR